MNKKRTLSLIRERFRSVTEIETDLFRAERRNNGSVMAVVYFDFGQTLKRSDFNLTEYLQRFITNDFYKHEGSLQWNYYLYFILEKPLFTKLWKDGTAAEIEADRAFARKFVKSEELLNKELTEPLAESVGSFQPPKDIAAAWTQALTDGGLATICDPKVPYTEIIEEFLSGVAERTPILDDIAPLPVAPLGSQISKLQIKDFRTHPSIKDFEFAKVNLIRGANGAGKTSLLEAIELSLCGCIRRQDGARPPGARLAITFVGEDEPQTCPQRSSTLYRARDLAWYGQYNRIGYRLCYNFGRFNFFDSDAAFRLSSANTTQEIKEAIGALFLGEHANTLEERMIACNERFQTEERQLAKKLTALRKEATKWTAEINHLERIVDTRDTLEEEVRSKASHIRWKKLPVRLHPKQLVSLKESVDDLISQLTEIVKQIHWVPAVSLRYLNEEYKRMSKCLVDINGLQESLGRLTENKVAAQEKLAKIESEVKTLSRLRVYHDVPEALSIREILASALAVRARLEQITQAEKLIKKIDFQLFKNSSVKLSVFRRSHESEIAKQQGLVSQKRAALDQLQRSVGETRALVQQIKGLGHRFCELDPNSKDCPLCNAHYEIEGLLSRIEPLVLESRLNSALQQLTVDLSREETKLSGLQRLSKNLETLGEAASLVLHSKRMDLSLNSITAALLDVGAEQSQERTKLEELTAKQSRLNLGGFSEVELGKLLSESETIFGSKLSGSTAVRKAATEREKRAAIIKKTLADYNKLDADLRRRVRQLNKECLGGSDVAQPSVEASRRLAAVEQAMATVAHAAQDISIRVTDDFAVLKVQLSTFSDALGRIQLALKQVEEKDLLEKRLGSSLKQTEKEISTLDPRQARAQQALKLIDGLLKSENKEQYLTDTVGKHREKLSTLFCKIHAPNEFEEVQLNGELTMKRSIGTKSSVSEISTGQRAALALSIFLTMNSSVSTRAPWLIFDDPVAHVDDLNILSFFDTLRDLLLLGNQQIFFATASSRIADLFVRKFDFLGADCLREFKLDRPN